LKTEALLFISQFLTIFCLGFQQQNVHQRRYMAAAATSVIIGLAQVFMWKTMPQSTPSQMVTWLAAGPAGIMFSMWLHPRIFKKRG